MLVCSHSFIHSNKKRERGQHSCPRYMLEASAKAVGETSSESCDYKNHLIKNQLAHVHVISTVQQSALENVSGGRNTYCKILYLQNRYSIGHW